MCRILGAKRGLRNPILLQSAERWIWEHCHCTVHQVCRQIVASCNGFNGPGGIAEQGTEIRSGIRLSRQLAAAHAMRPVLEGPARGGWPTGKCPSTGRGWARLIASIGMCGCAVCVLVGAAQVRARWACMCPGRLAAGPPRRFFDPRWIGRVPLPAAGRTASWTGGWVWLRLGVRGGCWGGSGGWAGGWWSRCPIYTGGSRSIRCRIPGALKQDVWTARAHGYALLYVSFDQLG